MQIHTSTYQDIYGFFHHVNNPKSDSSENPALFSAGVNALELLTGIRVSYVPYGLLKLKGNYVTHPNSKVLRFSHDNMTGLYIGTFIRDGDVKSLPIIKWKSAKEGKYNRNYWLHPRDIITYLIFRNSIFGYLLSPILLIMAMISFKAERMVTSGKCKWFYLGATWYSKGNKIQKMIGHSILKLGEIICKKEHGTNPFIGVFLIYFKDAYHPINTMLRNYYAKS